MNSETKSTRMYWLVFLISFAAMVLFLLFLPEWFWVTLPFVFTAFVYGMDWA